jgi:hypothetical protein
MKHSTLILIIMLFTFMAGFNGCSPDRHEISFATLLDEMIDRDNMAKYPDPFFVCLQASSYDRRSVSPDSAGWFANADRSNFIRTEESNGRVEQVLLDTDGPGAIVRFWATFAGYEKNGILRFYFDGENEPEIEGEPMDILSGEALTGKPLAASVSELTEYEKRGHNLYLPIPYRKHIKITYESPDIANNGGKPGTEAFYYQVNHRTYDTGVNVRTFRMSDLSENEEKISDIQQKLQQRYRGTGEPKDEKTYGNEMQLQPGDSASVTIRGGQAIKKISLKVQAADLPQALRSTVMTITFDGTATVWSPVGDFFGTGYQLYPSETWYQQVTEEGDMEAYWIMPFRRNCTIGFTNLGNQTVSLTGFSVVTKSWKWNRQSMYFGASWRQYTEDTGKPRDLNYTTLEGQGVLAGDGVALFDCNPGWWGEGDEKIYVDGETFPSHFGTGTEDYYGYAWCRDPVFTHPFISQPAGYANRLVGNTVDMRYRVLDRIPFRKSLRFDMELLHWTKTIVNFSPVTYWYIRPGGACKVDPSPEEASKAVILKRQDIFRPELAANDTIQGEDLILVTGSNERSAVTTFILPLRPRWQVLEMHWAGAEPGEEITVRFVSESAGTYRITGRFSTGEDHGTYYLSFNDGKPPARINGYTLRPYMKTVDLGMHSIKEGENLITVRCTDPVSTREAGSVFGLDFLTFLKD